MRSRQTGMTAISFALLAVDAVLRLFCVDDESGTQYVVDVDEGADAGRVRAALVAFQRGFARRQGGAVLDGRDIGTVICPEAEVKLFVTASDAVRAARRHAELVAGGHDVTPEQVLQDLLARDARDREREAAPMKQAGDALLLDTSEMDIDQAVAAAIAAVGVRLGRADGVR